MGDGDTRLHVESLYTGAAKQGWFDSEQRFEPPLEEKGGYGKFGKKELEEEPQKQVTNPSSKDEVQTEHGSLSIPSVKRHCASPPIQSLQVGRTAQSRANQGH